MKSVVFPQLLSACVTYTVHVHVHQMMIMSTDDPSSIWLKENRARTGHFAAHSINPSPAHGGGAVALSVRQEVSSRDGDPVDS